MVGEADVMLLCPHCAWEFEFFLANKDLIMMCDV